MIARTLSLPTSREPSPRLSLVSSLPGRAANRSAGPPAFTWSSTTASRCSSQHCATRWHKASDDPLLSSRHSDADDPPSAVVDDPRRPYRHQVSWSRLPPVRRRLPPPSHDPAAPLHDVADPPLRPFLHARDHLVSRARKPRDPARTEPPGELRLFPRVHVRNPDPAGFGKATSMGTPHGRRIGRLRVPASYSRMAEVRRNGRRLSARLGRRRSELLQRVRSPVHTDRDLSPADQAARLGEILLHRLHRRDSCRADPRGLTWRLCRYGRGR